MLNAGSQHYNNLKEKWEQKHAKSKEILWQKHAESLKWLKDVTHPKKLLLTSLSSIMLLNAPALSFIAFHAPNNVYASDTKNVLELNAKTKEENNLTPVTLSSTLQQSLPIDNTDLTDKQQDSITKTLSSYYGMNVTSNLEGISLNTNYGYIGQEQHLALFPGDNIYTHFTSQTDMNEYLSSGLAPGRGAWGYFAPSRAALTQTDIEREKYYIAVQTFMSPGYSDNVEKYYDFFKYRKVIVVNPQLGQSIVADIADSGPSPFTGKQFGGSPEVMSYLHRVDGIHRGTVLIYFIDDPNNQIPLGPINIKN